VVDDGHDVVHPQFATGAMRKLEWYLVTDPVLPGG